MCFRFSLPVKNTLCLLLTLYRRVQQQSTQKEILFLYKRYAILKKLNLDNVNNMPEEKTFKEELKVSGEQLVETVKKLVKETNVRRVIIKNEKGESLIEIPATFAAVGTILLPVLAALGAIAALVTNCTVEVEKVKDAK